MADEKSNVPVLEFLFTVNGWDLTYGAKQRGLTTDEAIHEYDARVWKEAADRGMKQPVVIVYSEEWASHDSRDYYAYKEV